MDLAVYFSAGPFKKLLLCILLCFPPGYLLLILIVIVYLVIMMILPTDQPQYATDYNYNYSHQDNGNLRARYELNAQQKDYSIEQEHENWRIREGHKDYTNPRESLMISSRSPVNVENSSQYDVSSSDWESFSISSEDSSFSTSTSSTLSSTSTERTFSTTASSLEARAELNVRAEELIKQEHDHRRWERQMHNSPMPSPISSPDPPFYKMGKNQEGKGYATCTRDEVLIYVAYYQTLKDKKSTSNKFNEGWWEAIIYGFFCETRLKYDKEQMKVRLRNMRNEWKAWTKVMNTAGFGWDPIEKTIRADDKCWTAYVEGNPKAKKIRESTFPLYEELTVIFNYLGKDQLHKEVKIPEENVNGNRHRRRTKKPSSYFDRKQTKDVSYSITDCSNVLQKMEDVQQTSEAALKAYDIFQNPGWREAFMVMKDEQRLAWIKSLGSIS